MPAEITRLRQIAITTQNVPALAAFYRDVVGLTHLFDAGPNLSFLDVGGVRLMLSLPSSPEVDHAPSILYYLVPDIDAAHAAIKARGAREERPPGLTARMPDHELWTSFFRDPDGNLFALMCEKR
ncbi:VOC family protein [Oleiharenicola sp. Vm1]|uniref:VOC family protein n=1 Tax=Oleiharenicola sp. Vm1 TaxID=3398393 RepID=UPI0039F50576